MAVAKPERGLLELQASLSLALVGRQQQLVEKECALCASLLVGCHRLHPCQHAVCAVCWEAGARYWRRCAQCGEPVGEDDGGGPDLQHRAVMALRLAAPACKTDAAFARVSAQWAKRRSGLGLGLRLEP